MSMIDPKGSAMDALYGKYSHGGGRFPVEKVIHDAIADVEDGVEFWKTLAGSRQRKHRASPEFLNRNG